MLEGVRNLVRSYIPLRQHDIALQVHQISIAPALGVELGILMCVASDSWKLLGTIEP